MLNADRCHLHSLPRRVEVLCGPMLCELRVWDDADWAKLAESERPLLREQVPGLGWVGAVPVLGLN